MTVLSLHVLMPFSRLQRSTRAATSPLNELLTRAFAFDASCRRWDNEQRTRWILERLRTQVRRAYEETVYYRELFDRSNFDPYADFDFNDFARLPVLTREDIHEAGDKLLASSVPADQIRKDSTGGSTGVPTQLFVRTK